MKTELFNRNEAIEIYELAVNNFVIDKEAHIIRKKLEEAIDAYEASNKMPSSSSVIDSYRFKKAIEAIFKENEHQTVFTIGSSSSVGYRIEIDCGTCTQGFTVYFLVVANFYSYEEI